MVVGKWWWENGGGKMEAGKWRQENGGGEMGVGRCDLSSCLHFPANITFSVVC